jgi:hypothetical protein
MNERGIALILAVLFTSFLCAIGLGLALVVFMDRLAVGNMRGSVGLLYAADAAIELAARDLSRTDDWSSVLAGLQRGTLTDGVPGGVRQTPGASINLTALTNQLNCGSDADCTSAQMDTSTRDRPWAGNNPRWQLYGYAPFGTSAELERPSPCYLVIWIADDAREQDDDPSSDAIEAEPGHGILRVRAEAFGYGGARRGIEAELVRFCLPAGTPGSCRASIRVQSWLEVRETVP